VIPLLAEFSTGMLIGVFAGIIGGIGGVFLLVMAMPRKMCPDCGAPLSKLRNCWDTPGVMRRCAKCGCGVDVKGRKVQK
jgi:hypothetical protein